MVGHRPLEASILVRVQVRQYASKSGVLTPVLLCVLALGADSNRAQAKLAEGHGASGGRGSEIF